MKSARTRTVSRGQRSPTAVWIISRKGKGGTTYRIRWINPQTGATASEACGRDLALARDRRDAKKAELRDGLSGRLPDKSLSDLVEALPTFMVSKSPHTVRKTGGSLDDLIRLCGDRRLEHVDRALLMDFRSQRIADGLAIATVNKDARQIKSALTYAVDAGWLRTNPLWRWKALLLREPEKRIRVIEPAEFIKLLEACEDPVFRVFLIVGYHQGLRRSELVHLRWLAVDLDRGLLHVVNVVEAGELTKSRKNRTLPMLPVVRDNLAALFADVPKVVVGGKQEPKYPHCFTWVDGQPYKIDWPTHAFARLVKKAGIPHCSLHDLRRSFSTLAQRAGVDTVTVKNLGGWSTIGVVEKHYTGEVPEAFERAMRTIAAAQGVA
jgi:integrase